MVESAIDIEALPPVLRCLSRLADLSLTGYSIQASQAASLAAVLRGLTALTRLYLCHNEFGQNEHGDGGTPVLAPALSCLSRLADLDLEGSGIDAAAAAVLARHLDAFTTLTALDLSWNELGEAGTKALAAALQRLSNLAALRLQGNELSDDSLVHLMPALACLPNLSQLDLLTHNRFSNAGKAQLRASFPDVR